MSTRELAKWVSSLSYEMLPGPAVAKAKRLIFDCIGASLFTACKTRWGSVVTDFAIANGGGQAEATVLGSGRKTLAVQAALANGTLAEGFESTGASLRSTPASSSNTFIHQFHMTTY